MLNCACLIRVAQWNARISYPIYFAYSQHTVMTLEETHAIPVLSYLQMPIGNGSHEYFNSSLVYYVNSYIPLNFRNSRLSYNGYLPTVSLTPFPGSVSLLPSIQRIHSTAIFFTNNNFFRRKSLTGQARRI